MYLSILFATPAQTTSIISHLVPVMYKTHPKVPDSCHLPSIASLLHFLVTAYPSQSRYSEHLSSLSTAFVPSAARAWLRELTRCLSQHNFIRIEQLTTRCTLTQILEAEASRSSLRRCPNGPQDLAMEALSTLLDTLRAKARDTSWIILRSVYRELSCPKPNDEASLFTRNWLLRSLLLRSNTQAEGSEDDTVLVDTWIQQHVTLGDIKAKEGVEGRWIVCKVKV